MVCQERIGIEYFRLICKSQLISMFIVCVSLNRKWKIFIMFYVSPIYWKIQRICVVERWIKEIKVGIFIDHYPVWESHICPDKDGVIKSNKTLRLLLLSFNRLLNLYANYGSKPFTILFINIDKVPCQQNIWERWESLLVIVQT